MVFITWTNTQKKATNMGRLAKRVGKQHTAKWGRQVAQVGEESVNFSVLSGGVNKTKKGGPRILSEAMINSVGERQKLSVGTATVSAGFGIDGRAPRWTIFQEEGTRSRAGNSGIPAMLAIPEAIENMEVEMDNAGMRMLGSIANEWNSSV